MLAPGAAATLDNSLLADNARIGSLRQNGGPTQTVALRRGSAAIGVAGDDAAERDERKLRRSDPDSGAFERR